MPTLGDKFKGGDLSECAFPVPEVTGCMIMTIIVIEIAHAAPADVVLHEVLTSCQILLLAITSKNHKTQGDQ